MNPVRRIIEQSQAIHPDWNPADHYSYLVNDEFVEEGDARQAVQDHFGLTAWPWLPGHGDWECYRCGHLQPTLDSGFDSTCPQCGSHELHLSDAARGLAARASAVHKAEPAAQFAGDADSICVHCHRGIRRVPGGHGPTWVHAGTGAVAAAND